MPRTPTSFSSRLHDEPRARTGSRRSPRRAGMLLLSAALSLTVLCVNAASNSHEPSASGSGTTVSLVSAAAVASPARASAAARHKPKKHKKHKQHKRAKRHAVKANPPAVAAVHPAPSSNPTNPLAGRTWGVYEGPSESAWTSYLTAAPAQRAVLAKIALRPKAAWFGDWTPADQIAGKIRAYVANSQAGDPNRLVQMSVFRMVPWEHNACARLPTAAEQAAYKQWTDQFASAIGVAHTAVILQPDGPFALCAPGGSTLPSSLVAYSARVFSALPNTSVYVDAGAADWPAGKTGVAKAVQILLQGGIRYARGFALNSTHYSSTNLEVARGAAVVQSLAAHGIPGKHFVVNTSSNGHPFSFGSYTGSDKDNADVCTSKSAPAATTCVTLGIPPTPDVANSRWRMWASTNTLARGYVDGYMWFGRPWLYRQAYPFQISRALQLVASTPY